MKVNRIIALRLMLSVAVIIGFASCSKKSSSKVRQELLAGMSIVKASGNKKQVAGPGLIFCGGNFTMGKVQDDVMHDWNNTPTQPCSILYMDETEVTNLCT
jgi:hypothetical protein